MTIGKGSSFLVNPFFFYIELFLQTLLFTTTMEEKASIHKETTHFETLVNMRGSNFIDI